MTRKHLGRQSVRFDFPPSILSYASVVGKKEGEGPLAAYFDTISSDTKFGQQTWEKAESQMQTLALQGALRKASLSPSNVHMLFAGAYIAPGPARRPPALNFFSAARGCG